LGRVTASICSFSRSDESRKLPDNTLVLDVAQSPAVLEVRTGGKLAMVKDMPARSLTVSNVGGLLPNGEHAGLPFEWNGVRIAKSSLMKTLDAFGIAPLLVNNTLNSQWIVGGGGPVKIDVFEDEGRYGRIVAKEDMPWLAAIFRGVSKDDSSEIAV
jgi:hypothetical protein